MKRIAAVLLCAALGALPAGADPPMRLTLLGTAGGPTPKRSRAAPAQAIRIGEAVYVVDCGSGVGRQMALAGIPFEQLRHVFVTHHHSDHVADLVTLPVLAWAAGLEEPVTLHGPAPIERAVKAGLRQNRFDIETRAKDEGRRNLKEIVRVHEFSGDRVVLRDERVTVRAARVSHPPIDESYAYRFDAGGRSIVISGDTAPSANLVRLAEGADVLVHEVLLRTPAETADWLRLPLEHPLVQHIVRSHTSYREVGRIATEARVRTLVLSHFVPGDEKVDEAKVLSAIREVFDGEVVFGTDLMEIP